MYTHQEIEQMLQKGITMLKALNVPIRLKILDWMAIARWLNTMDYISDSQCLEVAKGISEDLLKL